MHLQLYLSWLCFCAALAVAIVTNIIMDRQGRHFYTFDGAQRHFSILDLQFAASALEIVNIIKGIYKLPKSQSIRTLKALRGQLLVDFLFMPAIYSSVFFGCMHVSTKMTTFWGKDAFAILAWLQIIPWLCDIIENIYLWRKITPNATPSSSATHRAYQRMELIKWGLSLTGIVCSIAALLFFWVSGRYTAESFPYLLIVIGEVVLFFVLVRLFVPKPGCTNYK